MQSCETVGRERQREMMMMMWKCDAMEMDESYVEEPGQPLAAAGKALPTVPTALHSLGHLSAPD